MSKVLRLHHFEPASRANGPGLRAVIWVQGCTLGCPGCFNPLTHPRKGGFDCDPDTAAQWVLDARQHGIEGVTISGGEPLQQLASVTRLVKLIKENSDLSVLLFSGFSWEEIQKIPRIDALLTHIDVLLAGRYRQEERVASGLLGSANKTVHLLTPRYTLADLLAVPEAEITIAPDGEIHLSGINPLEM
ncbi:MAG TPA: radical SAM protein [Chloroflexi bacterium]|jgi:anaerobic ribonucleoside-triphosphate reductase activating protein|nr:radical SAM protein [Chloroflexota bacterium]